MATGDIAARNNGMDSIQTLLNIFKGAPGSTTTSSSSEQVSDDKTKALLQQMLESTSGLAAVSGGQKAAGMYKSTVNQQLTNDLLARAAAQTAALSATKTTTATNKPAAQLDPLKTLLSLGAQQLLSPVIKAGIKKTGVDKYGQDLADKLFGGGDSGGSMFVGGGADTTPVDFSVFSPSSTLPVDRAALGNIDDLMDMKSSEAGGGSSFGSTAAGLAASAGISSALGGGAATGGGYVVGSEGAVWGSSMAAGAAEGVGAETAGAAMGAEGLGTLGASAGSTAGVAAVALNDVLNLKQTMDSDDAGQWIGTILGGPQGGPVVKALETGDIFEALGPTGGLSKSIVEGWIICTELNKQGRLPTRFYYYGAREFNKYDTQGKQGYYIWAIPSVKHLRKYPNSLYSKLMEVVFNARAEYLSAKAGCKGARKTLLGAITTHGLYGFCWVLSRTIARKPYTRESILGIGA